MPTKKGLHFSPKFYITMRVRKRKITNKMGKFIGSET